MNAGEVKKNMDRLEESFSLILIKQDEMTQRLETMNDSNTDVRRSIDALRGEQTKTNLQLAENTRAILKLSDAIEHIPEIYRRIEKLEDAVFRK